MTPIAQRSLLKEYLLNFKVYGGIYLGDPTLQLKFALHLSSFIANPKSANLIFPLETNKLDSFKSL